MNNRARQQVKAGIQYVKHYRKLGFSFGSPEIIEFLKWHNLHLMFGVLNYFWEKEL